jgi:hypothetical protein
MLPHLAGNKLFPTVVDGAVHFTETYSVFPYNVQNKG